MSNTISRLVALLAVIGLPSAAHAGAGYTFTRLVDHVDDNFGPRTLTCASINESGDVAFKGTRSAPDGLNSWDVIARVNRAGVITTIAEDQQRSQFQFRGFLPDFITDCVFTGPNPKKNAILTSRDRLDGARILSGSFSVCSEALNNSGEVVIVDHVDDTRLEGFRSAIYLASPKKPLAP